MGLDQFSTASWIRCSTRPPGGHGRCRPSGGCTLSRQGHGLIPPGVRFGVMNNRSLARPLVAPLLMYVESPLVLPVVGSQTSTHPPIPLAPDPTARELSQYAPGAWTAGPDRRSQLRRLGIS